ncbi:rod shape-determining protein [bacterium]|nr:rod shape-determining protein [bacterium]
MTGSKAFAGIDSGSRTIKVVLWDAEAGCVVGRAIRDQGVEQARRARDLFEEVLRKQNLDPGDIAGVVATGYGRDAIDFADTTVTEITCHGRGVRQQDPEARTIVDIGGQDSKVIQIDGNGQVRDFALNDRCAAGTGRFLELVAERLEVSLEDLADLAAASDSPSPITSMCAVFAESEIIGLLAGGARRENIVAGVERSIANRVGSLAGSAICDPVVFTGGVAQLSGMRRAAEEVLGRPVRVANDPVYTGALGAALIAADLGRKGAIAGNCSILRKPFPDRRRVAYNGQRGVRSRDLR